MNTPSKKIHPAPRESFMFLGMEVVKTFARRPRILRLETSKPKSSSMMAAAALGMALSGCARHRKTSPIVWPETIAGPFYIEAHK